MRAKKSSKADMCIDEWEIYCKRCEEAEKITLSSQAEIYSLCQSVLEDLERNLIRSGHLHTYDNVRAYITEQVSIRRGLKNDGPVPMELDMARKILATTIDGKEELEATETSPEKSEDESCATCQPKEEREGSLLGELLSFAKSRWKGKGSEYGGKIQRSRLDGNCSICYRYGHNAKDCWHNNDGNGGEGKGEGKGKGSGVKGVGPQVNLGGKGGWKGGDDWKSNKGKGKVPI